MSKVCFINKLALFYFNKIVSHFIILIIHNLQIRYLIKALQQNESTSLGSFVCSCGIRDKDRFGSLLFTMEFGVRLQASAQSHLRCKALQVRSTQLMLFGPMLYINCRGLLLKFFLKICKEDFLISSPPATLLTNV